MNDLLDISKRLNTQDNRSTTEPMFCLQIKVRDVGYDAAYAGETVWINTESGDYEETEPNAPGAQEFGYVDRWETVMVAFTEQGIADYMDKDGHNVKRRAYRGETRVYVESFMRCDEMVRIRHALMSNANRQGEAMKHEETRGLIVQRIGIHQHNIRYKRQNTDGEWKADVERWENRVKELTASLGLLERDEAEDLVAKIERQRGDIRILERDWQAAEARPEEARGESG